MAGAKITRRNALTVNQAAAQDYTRVSDVETLSRSVVLGVTGTLGSGSVFAHRAKAVRGGTFTKITFCTGTTAPITPTDTRGGVWAADGVTKVSETAESSAIVVAASTVYQLTLLTPVVLTRGRKCSSASGRSPRRQPSSGGRRASRRTTARRCRCCRGSLRAGRPATCSRT